MEQFHAAQEYYLIVLMPWIIAMHFLKSPIEAARLPACTWAARRRCCVQLARHCRCTRVVWPDRQRLINRTAAHWACPPRPGLARCGVAREGEMEGAFVVCCWTLVSCLALARFLAAIARQWSSDPPCQATQRVRLGLGSSSAVRGHHGLVAPLSPINKRESRGDRGPL